ncbi:hypothetical protein FA15DRAFT_553589, partial [Coprinopsis marcescibilis]
LEKCRAQSLNQNSINGFYDTLTELITKYKIRPCNLYNMDEKGVQLGTGGSVAAIVDRDLRTV